jgi:DNA-binding PadR family transcriptional regulator
MIQKLVILGLLQRGPASGYDIKKFINKDLGIFSQLENQSVYYSLQRMEKDGLIKKEQLPAKKYLKKYVYAVTPAGSEKFRQLCKNVLLSQRRPFIESDVALYFLPYLDKKEIIKFLRLQLIFLAKVKQWLFAKNEELKSGPKIFSLLIEHHQKLLVREKDFLGQIIIAIKNNQL